MSNISHNNETWHSYTLPTEGPEIYKSCETLLDFCWHQHFFNGNQQLLLFQEIQIQIAFQYITSNSYNFFESLKAVLITMVATLMISAKLATVGVLKVKVFWNTGYSVINSVHDVTSKTVSRDSSYIVNVINWPKFRNFSISILQGFDQKKNDFFEGCSWFKFNNLGLALGTNLTWGFTPAW